MENIAVIENHSNNEKIVTESNGMHEVRQQKGKDKEINAATSFE